MMTYRFMIDSGRDGAISTDDLDITEYVQTASWSAGCNQAYQRVALPAELTLRLANYSGELSQHDTTATHYGKIARNALVRVEVWHAGAWVTMTMLKIVEVRETPRTAPADEMVIVARDWMDDLLRAPYVIPFLESVRVDEILAQVLEDAPVVYPSEQAYFFIDVDEIDGTAEIYEPGSGGSFAPDLWDFDEAYTTVNFAGYPGDEASSTAQRVVNDAVQSELLGMFFFQPREGKFRFFHRYHAAITDGVTLNESVFRLEQKHLERINAAYGDFFFNDYEITYYPRDVGGAGSVLWSADDLPIALRPGRERTFRVKFTDSSGNQVAAKDVLPMTAGTDWTALTDPDGGFDFTNQMAAYADVRADGATITLAITDSSRNDTVYVQSLQIRGTPVAMYESETATTIHAQSIYDSGRVVNREAMRYLDDADQAQGLADMMIASFANQRRNVRELAMTMTASDASLRGALIERSMGDVITVVDEINGEEDYMIVGERHAVDARQMLHRVTWTVRPVAIATPFIINTSEIDGTDVILI